MTARGKGRGAERGTRKSNAPKNNKPALPMGRPPRLAHLVPGTDRQRKRDRARQMSLADAAAAPIPAWYPVPGRDGPAQPDIGRNILCLASPEWLPHVVTVVGPLPALAAFRRAAAGPGVIPWVTDYDRLEEDWVNAMLTPAPSERGISVEGARILARQLRERIEQQEQRAAEAAFGSLSCPFDLHALVPVPLRILRLGSTDPTALAWLWENWTTTWALRDVEEIEPAQSTVLPEGHDVVCYRFWSADWTPWKALAAIRSRWPSISVQISVRAVSE